MRKNKTEDLQRFILPVVVGVLCMVFVDLGLAQVSRSMLGIPIAVAAGAIVAGFMAKNRLVLVGASVGLTNAAISLVSILSVSAATFEEAIIKSLLFIGASSLAVGVVGAVVGGALRKRALP